jgi:hypothetical protein
MTPTVTACALLAACCLLPIHTGAETAPIKRGPFSYYFSNPVYIDRVDSALNGTRSRLQSLLRDSLAITAEIHLVETASKFDSLIGGRFPEWGAAVAVPLRRLVVIKSPDQFTVNRPLEELAAHEFTHLALAERTGRYRVPRWFDEGLAMLVSYEWSWQDNLTASLAAVTGDFVPLRAIERVNETPGSRARLAYAESYLAVQYLYDGYGNEAVNMFLDTLASGVSVDGALMASTGSNYADFEQEFFVYLRQRHNFATLLADTMYFWLGLAVILIVGAVLTMRRRRKYYDQWKRDERLESTDFDYGDPENPEEPDEPDDEPWRR